MKNIFKILFVCSFFILFSCSSDDTAPNDGQAITETKTIVGYQETTQSNSKNGDIETIKTGSIIDNKYTDWSRDVYIDGNLFNSENGDEFIYENNRIVKHSSPSSDVGVKHFYYNETNQLKGIFWKFSDHHQESYERYYRIIHISDSEVYFESLHDNYDNPNASFNRIILHFDEDDNIVKAGYDQDLDGVMDISSSFEYQDNNLVTINHHNGNTYQMSYTDKINTKLFLRDNSYSKKTHRILCAQIYNLHNHSTRLFDLSYNLSTESLVNNVYEFEENGFYNKKIEVENLPEATITRTEEYFFE